MTEQVCMFQHKTSLNYIVCTLSDNPASWRKCKPEICPFYQIWHLLEETKQ